MLYTIRMALSSDRKNILVTGGAGFIGSHLCEALVQRANVICVDNFSTGSPSSIQNLLQHPHFEFLRHDIHEPLALEEIHELDRFHVRVHGIQEIYHLACPTSKSHADKYRLAVLETNSMGVKNVMDLAVKYQAKVVYASTSSVYEASSEPFISEDARCWNEHLEDEAAYVESKRFAETLVHTYGLIHRLPVKIVRIFRTYGPRMRVDEGYLLPELVEAILASREYELPYSEDARLSLCYVKDMVDGLVRVMDHAMEFRVMNLGSDQELRLGAVVERLLQLTGSTARIRFASRGSGQVAPVPNIDKARQLLHWLPLTRLDDGLKQMIEYARSARQEFHAFMN